MKTCAGMFILFLFGFQTAGLAQTCCSGGVPVSANIGLPLADPGTFHLGLSYDLNILQTLKNGSNDLDDRSRERQTQSILLELGYSITERFSVDLLSSHVRQTRDIQSNGFTDNDMTNGIGDLVLLAKYQVINSGKASWSIGAGPKLPTGASDLKDSNGLTLVADLQPGSGALDWLIWSQLAIPLSWRPTMNATFSFVQSLKGKNDEYLGVQTYQFGTETQIAASISDQVLLGNTLLDPSITVRYRKANKDIIDDFILPNTGGEWIFLSPSISTSLTPKITASVSLDLPMMATVVGTQLSPTTRWNMGIYIQLTKNKLNVPNETF